MWPLQEPRTLRGTYLVLGEICSGYYNPNRRCAGPSPVKSASRNVGIAGFPVSENAGLLGTCEQTSTGAEKTAQVRGNDTSDEAN